MTVEWTKQAKTAVCATIKYVEESITYRSLIVKRLNKMVYRIDNDCIIIVDFWNLRRNPDKLRNQVQ